MGVRGGDVIFSGEHSGEMGMLSGFGVNRGFDQGQDVAATWRASHATCLRPSVGRGGILLILTTISYLFVEGMMG